MSAVWGEVEQCVLCASPSMICKAKDQRVSQLKYQIRTMFVLRKLLGISNSTCSDLLKFGNPSTWFSYCFVCYETVIEAESAFFKLMKLEAKWNNLKKGVEEKIYQRFLQNKDSQAPSLKVADTNIIGRIWNETVERLHPISHIDVDSISVQNEIKIEIDEDFCSNGIASDVACSEYKNEESDSGTLNDAGNDKSEIPIQKKDLSKHKESMHEKSHGSYNLKNNVGRRTRSGRLIKPKSEYITDSDDNNLRAQTIRGLRSAKKLILTDAFDHENDSSDYSDYTDDDVIKPKKSTNKAKLPHTQQDELSGQSTLVENLDFQCQECGKILQSSIGLLRHEIRIHDKDDDKPYRCSECGKGVLLLESLRRHLKSHHSGKGDVIFQRGEFPCDFCPSFFSSVEKMKSHVYTAHKRQSLGVACFRCLFCKENFASAGLLDEHIKSHHGQQQDELNEQGKDDEMPYQCRECGKGMMLHHSLLLHMQNEHSGKSESKKKFCCENCTAFFSTDQRLMIHIYKVHKSVDFAFQCTLCDKKFVSAGLLDIHNKSHHSKQEGRSGQSTSLELSNFQCKQCPKFFQTLQGLIRHEVRTHVSGKDKPYPCDKCHKGFFIYKKLLRHDFNDHKGPPLLKSKKQKMNNPKKKKKSKVREKPFACNHCERVFISEKGREIHIVTVHDNNYTVQCQECPKRFKYTHLLKYHVKHIHRKEKDFICEICSMPFAQRLQLKYHIMRVHENSEELKCKECGHMSTNPFVLKKHIAMVHNRSSCAFKCPICDYRTINKSALKTHIIRRHTNKKLFSCTLCDKSYSSKTGLDIHMRTHTGERPFVCQFCYKTFHSSEKVKRHEEDLHSTEKPYQCELCGKTFPSKHYLSTHVYDVHKKRQKDPVPEKVLISDELLEEVINQN